MSRSTFFGTRSASFAVMAAGIKRMHEPPRIVGTLLQSGIARKQARSIRDPMTVAKPLLAKDAGECDVTGTPVKEGLARERANGGFVADQRNVVLIDGTGTDKPHLAIAIVPGLTGKGNRGRFYIVVDLGNRLATGTRGGKKGRPAKHMARLDVAILGDLGEAQMTAAFLDGLGR